MRERAALPSYAGYRFPPEIIAHAVWRYVRFAMSYRDVEELLAERGVLVTDETVRQWCRKFGQTYANELRRRRPRPGDTWHLDAVFVGINGTQHYLWRAVDQDGTVLDSLVQSRRDKAASAGCASASRMCRASSSPTNSRVTARPGGRSCRASSTGSTNG